MKTRFIIVFALAFSAAAAICATVTVVVQKAPLRERAQSYSRSIGAAREGQQFETLALESGFYKTSSGYIHVSAVQAKKARFGSAGSVGGGASADEITLASKGFNPQVEKAYREQNASLDFAKVDAMESHAVSEAELFDFLRKGGLIAEGGSK